MEAQNQLIEAAQRGSMGAFEQLIISLERKMLAVAASLASYPDEADDIYQEAIMIAYRELPNFRSESLFSTWLYRIFVNTALNYRRKLSNRLSRHISSRDENEVDEEQYKCPNRNAENKQLSLAIGQAIKNLSEKERVAFVLCHQQELTVNEAAEVMECSSGAIKSYLFRARDKLRKLLREYK